MIKFFHELTNEDFKQKVAGKMTWGELAEQYPQPKWCTYPKATLGIFGCWSLISFWVTSEDYCEGCEFHKEYQAELLEV